MKNTKLSSQTIFGYFDGLHGFGIEMTLAHAQTCSHSGQCDTDVELLLAQPEINSQFDKFSDAQLKDALMRYGAWDEPELNDRNENMKRALWSAAGDIAEQFLKETVPVYVAKGYYMDKTLTADSFEVIPKGDK